MQIRWGAEGSLALGLSWGRHENLSYTGVITNHYVSYYEHNWVMSEPYT